MCITTSKKLEFFSHRGKRQKLVQIRQFIYLIELIVLIISLPLFEGTSFV